MKRLVGSHRLVRDRVHHTQSCLTDRVPITTMESDSASYQSLRSFNFHSEWQLIVHGNRYLVNVKNSVDARTPCAAKSAAATCPWRILALLYLARETLIYSSNLHEGCPSDALYIPSSPPSNMKSKPRPRPLSRSELLLRYSEEHHTLVAELDEALCELSALIREMCLLLASHAPEGPYH